MRFDLVVNVLTARACRGETLEIWGGGQRRPFLHVRDASAAFASVLLEDALLTSNGIFNVRADANNHRITDITGLVFSAIPSARREFFLKAFETPDHGLRFS